MLPTNQEEAVQAEPREYEPPTITVLGEVAELTEGGVGSSFDGITNASSDIRLKRRIRPL
jgi:hypothetical protein